MKLQTVAIALVVSLGVLALAAPVMAAAADVERCSGLAGLWRDIAQARDKGGLGRHAQGQGRRHKGHLG